eukprot:Plantae.Rhodophyta-Purpureofilum_apyrenoidigerum.ctg28832.p1 GENE.Plantae.Rhodophyta-Purpureofilum_apyrenoidigerum.ctg28832~~Plantae.Rhodophyta-Purpureofilum_apyrenoidigerum.ctg28832.p1  ORF type:complete len:279 (+),score=41.49 Plantae.Rhodophyta-Purpureofilum_apyrenoidigerum.ctg28832:76-912(+)
MLVSERCSGDDRGEESTWTSKAIWQPKLRPLPDLREVLPWSPVSMSASTSWDSHSKILKVSTPTYNTEMQREQNVKAAQGMVAQVMELSSVKMDDRNDVAVPASADSRPENFVQMLHMFMGLFNESRNWKYAELWVPTTGSIRDRNAVLKMAYGVVSTEDEKVNKFHKQSEQFFVIGKECLPGRVWRSCKPEWLSCATDCRTSSRADLAFRCGIVVGFAVPVFAEDSLFGVLCFFDNELHEYDAKSIYFASSCSHTLASAQEPKQLHADRDRPARVPL